MQERLREIIERVYDAGYGITGKTEEGKRYVVDKFITQILQLFRDEVVPKKLDYDTLKGGIENIENRAYNQAIDDILKKLEANPKD